MKINHPTTIKCDFCGRKVVKEKALVNYARKHGKRMYCNLSCAGKVRGYDKGARRDNKFDRQYGAYLTGESKRSIARRLGVSNVTVNKAFNRRSFKKRPKWLTNEEQREVIRAMYATGDYTQEQLAICFNYKSYVSIGQIIRR